MVYIPKVGKDALAKSYRPISLMNYLLKGLERLSVWVADTALEDNPQILSNMDSKKEKVQRQPYQIQYTRLKSTY